MLQVGSHESGVKGQNPLPRPAGHVSLDAAQDTAGFLGCKCTLPAHVEILIHQQPQAVLLRDALETLSTQPVLMFWIAPIIVIYQPGRRQKNWFLGRPYIKNKNPSITKMDVESIVNTNTLHGLGRVILKVQIKLLCSSEHVSEWDVDITAEFSLNGKRRQRMDEVIRQ